MWHWDQVVGHCWSHSLLSMRSRCREGGGVLGGCKKLMGLWLSLNSEYPAQERLVEKESGSLQLKCGGNWPQRGCGRVLYSGGDSWRQSCPLNPQQVSEGPTSPTVTSEIPPHQPGCTQDLWDLSGVLRSGPLPCPDGPGLPLSIPGERQWPLLSVSRPRPCISET